LIYLDETGNEQFGEPGLEISDFVINTAGRHMRHFLKAGTREANDFFDARFQRVPKPLVGYTEITSAQDAPPESKRA
jgi:hypothetical protein